MVVFVKSTLCKLPPPPYNPPVTPTDAQRRVLRALKARGPLTTAGLAEALATTNVGARQHALALAEAGLIREDTTAPAGGGRGRPAALWALTDAAAAYFPDAHAELTIGLISATRRALGNAGLQKVIDARASDQARQYHEEMPPPTASLRKRVQALATIRSREGYMAQVEQERPGAYLLIENHCPICEAATACQGLCAAELDVFRSALGPGVAIERTEHMLKGERRCVYRITKAR